MIGLYSGCCRRQRRIFSTAFRFCSGVFMLITFKSSAPQPMIGLSAPGHGRELPDTLTLAWKADRIVRMPDVAIKYDGGRFAVVVDGVESRITFDQAVRLRELLSDALRAIGVAAVPATSVRAQFAQATKTCPRCSGSGIYIDYGGPENPVCPAKCQTCNGTGSVPRGGQL
jgi:hypothetical protein